MHVMYGLQALYNFHRQLEVHYSVFERFLKYMMRKV